MIVMGGGCNNTSTLISSLAKMAIFKKFSFLPHRNEGHRVPPLKNILCQEVIVLKRAMLTTPCDGF